MDCGIGIAEDNFDQFVVIGVGAVGQRDGGL
jgi:hypothetical protein